MGIGNDTDANGVAKDESEDWDVGDIEGGCCVDHMAIEDVAVVAIIRYSRGELHQLLYLQYLYDEWNANVNGCKRMGGKKRKIKLILTEPQSQGK